jgi:cytochrome c-type biogenesis protein CcmH
VILRLRRTLSALLILVTSGLIAPAVTPAAATHPRASLLDVENDVMCVVCNEPLSVSDSPEAYQERNFIRKRIAQGETKGQIERQLVVQYGPGVLGKPPAHGFNLAVYVLPPAIVLLGLAILFFTLPRWRRRSRAARDRPIATQAAVDPGEERRLEDELARYGG